MSQTAATTAIAASAAPSKPPPLYPRTLPKHLPLKDSNPALIVPDDLRIAFVDYTPEDARLGSLGIPFQLGSYPRLHSVGPHELPDDYMLLPALSAVGKYPSESPCSSPLTPLEDSTSQTLQYLLQQPLHPPVLLQSTGQHRDTMVKKRRSLQSILIPPFFYSTSSTETSPNHTTRLRSNSAAAATTHSPIPSPIPINPSQPSPSHSAHTSPRNSPPSDLLDDDPFANLTPGPSLITDSSHNRARSQSLALPRLSTSSGPSSEPPAVPTPRSPLSQNALPVIPSLASVLAENASSFQADVIPPAPPSTPPVPETHSRSFRGPWIPGQGQLRPAYTRPAFKPRPSLPSLRSLTEGQVVVPRVRRGRVGARLPSEPWDSQGSDFSTSESEASESPRPSHFRRPSNLETIRDSRFYNAAGLLSNGDSEDTSSEEAGPSSLMPPSVPPLDTTFTLPPQTELDQTFPIVAVPQLPRTRSEPVPSSRHAFDFGSHSRESSGDTVSSSSSVSLFSSHYLTTSPESLVSCDSSYTSLFSRRRTNTHSIINDELSSTLEYDYSDAVLSLNPSSSSLLSISQSSSSNDVSSEEVGYSNQAISENFEPGTSADTIRSVPIHHQRSVSNLSETLVDWTPTQSELLLSPTRSTSSSDRSSGVSGRGLQPSCEMMSEGSEEYGGGYGADFISFNSDSSEEEDGEEEEHLPCSTPLSRSSSSIGGEERGVRRMSSGSTVFSAWSLRTPQNSLYEVGEDQNATFDFDDDDDDVEEEEEVCLEERRDETERISVLYSPIHQTFVQDPSEEEAVDAGEGSGKGYSSSRYDGHSSSHGDYGRWNAGNNNNGSNGGGGGSSWGGGNGFSGAGGGGGGGRRGNDGDDQWRRRPSGRALVPATSKDSDTSEDEEQDDHSEETHSPRPVKSQVKQVNSSAISSDDDDDVPLAQQIPTALKAQKTIRRQVRDERAQRREERRQRAERSSPASHVHSFVSTTATTTTTAGITERSPPSSRAQAGQPQDGSTSLSRVPSQARPTTRPRTRTLPSKPTSPYVLQDLTAKLLDVQVGTSGNGNGSRSRRPSAERPTPPTTITTIATAHRSRGESNRPSIEGSPNHFSSRTQQQPQQQQPQLQVDNHLVPPPRSPAVDGYMIEGGVRPRNNLLRPSKSFHRPRTANGEIEHMVPPVPFDSKVKLSRSATTIGKQRVQHDVHPPTTFSPSFSPFAASHREREREREREEVGLERGKSMRTTSSRAPSFERSRRSSNDHNYDGYPSSPRPPLPHRPSAEVVPPHSSSSLPSHSPHLPPPPPQQKAEPTWQQRIFVGTLQRFCQVEVGGSTMAGDVLRILEGQAVFPDGSRKGWMMWEICQDFGMERPIRSFELLTDVSGSWNTDKTVNVFMAKKTPLANSLSQRAVPSSSPICHGQVQHEYKRGKWQKRYLELREHGLWLAKKDTGKDQVFLCSLSNFDAYVVTRVYKAPKSFVFAVKSTDNLSFFENTDDYMHVFSCDTKDGVNWLEKILLARSYVLHQERNVLSISNPVATSASASSGAALSRSGTRKHQRPVQPLVNLSAASAALDSPTPKVFEPGSLLAKRGI